MCTHTYIATKHCKITSFPKMFGCQRMLHSVKSSREIKKFLVSLLLSDVKMVCENKVVESVSLQMFNTCTT